jgi:Protein tyrosine and serine/threonine kinase
VKWTAPELLQGDPYSTKADVFSVGVLLWELYTAQEPYPGLSGPEIVQRVINGERLLIPAVCPPRFRSVLESCWCADSTQRPSFSRLLQLLEDDNLMYRPVSMRKHAFS